MRTQESDVFTPVKIVGCLLIGLIFITTKVVGCFYSFHVGPTFPPTDQALTFLIPLIIAAIGAGASYLKQRAQGKSVEEQQRMYNEWLQNRSNGINDLIEKVTAGGSNPFGPQTSTSQTNSLSTAIQNMLSQTSTKPVITPEYKKMEETFRNLAQQRLNMPTALPPGYIQSQVRNINQSFAGTDQAARNVAARRGLSGEATFGLAMPSETARAGKIADFLGTVPLTERDMRTQDLQLAADLTRAFGLGSESTTKSSGTTTTRGSSASTMTSPPNLSMLANLLLPPSPNSPVNSGMSTTGILGGDLATILSWLWQQGAFGGKTGGAAPSPYTGGGGSTGGGFDPCWAGPGTPGC